MPPTAALATATVPGLFKLAVPKDITYAGEILAAESGLFERAGLQIQLSELQPGEDPVAFVVAGIQTFGVTSGINFLIARSKGARIVSFGASFVETPIIFLTLNGSGIRGIRDVVGRKIVREAESETAIIFDAALASSGLARNQIQEVITPAKIDDFLNRKVDVIPAYIGKETWILEQRSTQAHAMHASDYGIHVPGLVYFTTENVLRANPVAVQRFLSSAMAGWTFAYSDYDKSIPMLLGAIGNSISASQARHQLIAQRDYIISPVRRLSEFDDIQWKQLKVVLTNMKLINPLMDLTPAIDYSFLREAHRKSVTFGN